MEDANNSKDEGITQAKRLTTKHLRWIVLSSDVKENYQFKLIKMRMVEKFSRMRKVEHKQKSLRKIIINNRTYFFFELHE